MSFEIAEAYLREQGFADRITRFQVSSATVELAAIAAGCEPARIAKSLTFDVKGQAVMILAAGDQRIDNRKFKDFFHAKPRMLTPEQVVQSIGHEVGGVCPFGIDPAVPVYLEEGLRRFDEVFPACGDAASSVRLTPDELFALSRATAWIDVCKIPELAE